MLDCGVEPGVETPVELGEVCADAELGISLSGVDSLDLDQPSREERLDLGHRLDQAFATWRAELFEKRAGQLVAPLLEQVSLHEPRPREPHRTDPPVVLVLIDADELGSLE